MFYIKDFINQFGPERALEEYKKAQQLWALPKRAFHQHKTHCRLGWIKQKNDLREATAIPLVFEWECQEGYFALDLVH